MSSARIAARYVKPLFELAEEKKVVEAVKNDMLNFSQLCKTNREFNLMLKSPIITNLKKAAILVKIFDKKVNPLTLTFFTIIARKSREQYLSEIAEQFETYYNEKMGFQPATVTTTIKLDAAMKKAFEQLVTDITGKKPLLEEKINPELVGGYLLKLGDQQIDESISGQLKDLKLKFQQETI
ncbi:MAG: F-type H+-transporting ATPase subunit delta [Marinoscillum sp.]|jgi:F-type H+-transporting ATPase subunit delta